MTLLNFQLAMAGLACIAAPILIHLLMRRRRRPVRWAAMRFLLEAYRRRRRRLRLEQWLLLAARCLVVAMIAMAIGRPLIGAAAGGRGGRTVYFVIDDSIASAATDNTGLSALSRHQQAAAGVLGALAASAGGFDRAALVTASAPAEGVVIPPSVDLDAVGKLIEALEPTDAPAELAPALDRVRASIEAERERAGPRPTEVVVVLSDFRAGSLGAAGTGEARAGAIAGALPGGVVVVASPPAPAELDDVAIVSVEPLRPVLFSSPGLGGAGGEQVRVTLRRFGGAVASAQESAVRVSIITAGSDPDNAPFARAAARWSPGQETMAVTAQLPLLESAARRDDGGVRGGDEAAAVVARLEAADGNARDDVRAAPIAVRESLRVGLIAPRSFAARLSPDKLDAASWLKLALRPGDVLGGAAAGGDGRIEVAEIDPASLDAARIALLDAAFVTRPDLLDEGAWRRLGLFVESGGLLVVVPPAEATVNLWPDVMSRELGVELSLAREPVNVGSMSLTPPARGAGEGDGGESGGEGGVARSLLAMIRGELGELARPVRVMRVLPRAATDAAGPDVTGVLLSLEDGTPFAWVVPARETGEEEDGAAGENGAEPARNLRAAGVIVYMSAPPQLEWTDLPAKPLMVPLIQEIVRQGVGAASSGFSTTAGGYPPAPRRAVALEPFYGVERAPVGVAEEGDRAAEPVRRSGVFKAVDDRGGVRGVVAVNPDAEGADTGVTPADVAAAALGRVPGIAAHRGGVAWLSAAGGASWTGAEAVETEAAGLLVTEDEGSPISFWLLLGALVAALAEIVLARMVSHPEAGGAGGTAVAGRGPAAAPRAA